jgi:hypothetical protein
MLGFRARASGIVDLAYKYTNKINYQLLVRVLKKVNTASTDMTAWQLFWQLRWTSQLDVGPACSLLVVGAVFTFFNTRTRSKPNAVRGANTADERHWRVGSST